MKPLPLVKILKDTAADTARKRVSNNDVSDLCLEIARWAEAMPRPDLVVAIAQGGSVMGEEIAVHLQVPVIHMVIRRDIRITRMYNKDPQPLRWLMGVYHHFLFHTTPPKILEGIKYDISDKSVLIVDDSLHTGATLDVAIPYLQGKKVRNIKIATLAYVADRKPDFSPLDKGNYSFPWSKDFDPTIDS